MVVNVFGGDISEEEKQTYVRRAEELHTGTHTLDIHIVDDEYVDLDYHTYSFDRIRRITGYLVGTVDRWNDAKCDELKDRVKHTIKR